MEPVKKLKMNPTLVDAQIFGGTLLGVLWFMAILALPGLPFYHIGFIIMLIVMGVWNSSRYPIKCYEDHMEVKLAPISALHLINYRDITDIDDNHPKYTKVTYNDDGRERSLKLHWKGLEEKAEIELSPYLQEKWLS